MIGSTLSHFRILARLGAGAMGEVYSAEDSVLRREVAIKVLPPGFVADPDRVSRFEREARVLASLSHPSVAGIFEVGRENGTHFLVMELARGNTLADRLARGALPLGEALPIALQIAEALEAAHQRGIVHRDLKPGNVMVDDEGRVKVLDFGLAKALGCDGGTPEVGDVTHAPTATGQATAPGVLLGTAGYMSPEQAKGRPVDRRADVWAFGVLLWEMLTGKRLFAGETVSDVLAAVLRAEVDLSLLPPATPPEVRRLLRRCLAREPRQRLHDIADARLELAEAIAPLAEAPLPSPTPRRSSRSLVWLGALGLLALSVAGAVGWLLGRGATSPPRPTIHLPLALPKGYEVAVRIHSSVALSSDGQRQVVVAQAPDGQDVLVARDLGTAEARVLAGTQDAQAPFFSPDGEWVGYFTVEEMRRVPFAGGPSERLTGNAVQARGATWSSDGTIFFAPGPESGLLRLAPGAGEPSPFTALDPARRERTHRWPHALPDGRHVLFTNDTIDSPQTYDDARIEVVEVATGKRKELLQGASRAAYLTSGHLIFARGNSLFAAPFDPGRLELTGPAEVVLQGVSTHSTTGAARFAVAQDGSLLYVPGTTTGGLDRRPVWVTGVDSVEPLGFPPGPYFHLALSPDGERLALTRVGERANDLWVGEVGGDTLNRLTFQGGMGPVWTPDGRRIAYQRASSATFLPQDSYEVLWKAADGSDDEQVLWRSPVSARPSAFSPDGKLLLVYRSETPA